MAQGKYLFTSESVSMGHPDKLADQISDGVLDALFAKDPYSRVACETMVTTGMAVIAGEITSKATIDYSEVVRNVIRQVGYVDDEHGISADTCAVLLSIDRQSPDIAQGVNEDAAKGKEIGAGDQGLMFGYACNDTPELMPLPIALAHRIIAKLTAARFAKEVPWLRPDSKSQVTIEYDGIKPVRVDTVVVSTQHSPEVGPADIRDYVINKIINPVLPKELVTGPVTYHVNPTGRFVVGGPHGDCGLTGRKIIVDTYGGWARHGGGAFSGKDPTKVDRSAGLHGALRGQEHRRFRFGQPLRSAVGLRDRRFRPGERTCRYGGHWQTARRTAVRAGAGAFPLDAQRHHPAFGPAAADLPEDGVRRAFRPLRAGVHLGADRPRGGLGEGEVKHRLTWSQRRRRRERPWQMSGPKAQHFIERRAKPWDTVLRVRCFSAQRANRLSLVIIVGRWPGESRMLNLLSRASPFAGEIDAPSGHAGRRPR